MTTCPSNAVISSQEVTTGNLTCYDIDGRIIGNVLTGNPPLSIGGTNKCPLQTSKIKTNLTTNSYQCEGASGGILDNSNPCPAGWVPNYFTLFQNGTLEYGCNNSTGSSTPFSCAYGITPTQNKGLTPMTGCIIPARPSIPTPTSTPTSRSPSISSPSSISSSISSSNTSSSNTSSSNTSSSNTSSSNSTSSSFSPSSNSVLSFIESISNIGASTIIIGILITITVIGVISYFVFFRGSSNINKSVELINKGGYYYFK